MKRLFISFSGGETSALMTHRLLNEDAGSWDEIVVMFANTGQESEETLAFVDWCDRELFAPLGYPVVWVEADVHHGVRKNPTARVVRFATASRLGEPFEEMIRKYGIPNHKFKHCTRSLKLRPMEDYVHRVLGWPKNGYHTAIGIRADEIDRISPKAEERRIIYPLAKRWPTTKPGVNAFWREQPRRLRLKGYEGNCKWCWKKSFRKHFTLLAESPEAYDFPERMEREYGLVGPEFLHDPATRRDPLPPDYRRVFFRGNASVADLKASRACLPPSFRPAPDDADIYPSEFDPDLDVGSGCEESCEVFSDDQLDLFDMDDAA